jgi:hypothetical protein
MTTKSDFNSWFQDFSARFPSVAEYLSRQANSKLLVDTWHKTLIAFTKDTLAAVTTGIIAGEFEPVPNTALGQFAHEIRTRAKVVVERTRRGEPQEWTQIPLLGTMLAEPKMARSMKCAKAVDRLLGNATSAGYRKYTRPGSVHAEDGSYDAAIIMADDHTAAEERMCLETFAQDGLTWEKIQQEAGNSPASVSVVKNDTGREEF